MSQRLTGWNSRDGMDFIGIYSCVMLYRLMHNFEFLI